MNRWCVETKVAGITFEGRQAVAALVAPGDWLRVVREPDNRFDPNACGLWRVDQLGLVLAGGKVGFVPRGEVELVVRSFLEGFEVFAHVDEVLGGGELSIGLRVSLRRRLATRDGSME